MFSKLAHANHLARSSVLQIAAQVAGIDVGARTIGWSMADLKAMKDLLLSRPEPAILIQVIAGCWHGCLRCQ